VEVIEALEKSGQEFAEFLRVETSTGEFLHTRIDGFTEDVIDDAKMLALSVLDLEGVAHKSNVVVAWMVRVGREKLLCNFASTFQEVLAQGVDVDFDGDIFVVASTLFTVCRLVGHLVTWMHDTYACRSLASQTVAVMPKPNFTHNLYRSFKTSFMRTG
jgi:hypothetical protein